MLSLAKGNDLLSSPSLVRWQWQTDIRDVKQYSYSRKSRTPRILDSRRFPRRNRRKDHRRYASNLIDPHLIFAASSYLTPHPTISGKEMDVIGLNNDARRIFHNRPSHDRRRTRCCEGKELGRVRLPFNPLIPFLLRNSFSPFLSNCRVGLFLEAGKQQVKLTPNTALIIDHARRRTSLAALGSVCWHLRWRVS